MAEYQNPHEYIIQITSKMTITLLYEFKLWGSEMFDLRFLDSEKEVESGTGSYGE